MTATSTTSTRPGSASPEAGRRRVRLAVGIPVAGVLLVVAIVLSIGIGPIELDPRTTLDVV